MTSSKLSELKELRLKLTHHKWIYSEILTSDEPSLEGVEVVSENDHEIVCSLDKENINDWKDSAHFIVAAANNWLTLIECLEIAVEAFELISIQKENFVEDAAENSINRADKTLAEIESKLGGA